MPKWKSISDIRREYGELSLIEKEAKPDPFEQFEQWFKQILDIELSDPTAMTLSTVDKDGLPDSRVVLLKGIAEQGFIFYTNYLSNKGQQLSKSPYAAINFYWPQLSRQVRIRGKVKKLSSEQTDKYFASRPIPSQISAIASKQSTTIKNRLELELRIEELIKEIGSKTIIRPQSWGGYNVIADEFEFWQGRDNRLHDRIHYYKLNEQWCKETLSP